MTIYTKKGDRGETSVYDEANTQRVRISKSSLRVSAIGLVDELNSYLGVIVSKSDDKVLTGYLLVVQNNLLRIGSMLAGSNLRFFESNTEELERQIDKLEGTLPVLKNFIFPGGTVIAGHLHYARTLARKAERKIVEYSEEEKVKPQVLKYINRLSDYLFMLAREQNHKYGIGDASWKPKG